MLHSARLEITWNKYPGSWGPHLSLAKKWYRGRAKAHSRFALVWKAANITTHSVIISESMALEWHTAELLMTPWSFSLYDIAHCNQQNVRPLINAVIAPTSWIDQSLKKGNNVSIFVVMSSVVFFITLVTRDGRCQVIEPRLHSFIQQKNIWLQAQLEQPPLAESYCVFHHRWWKWLNYGAIFPVGAFSHYIPTNLPRTRGSNIVKWQIFLKCALFYTLACGPWAYLVVLTACWRHLRSLTERKLGRNDVKVFKTLKWNPSPTPSAKHMVPFAFGLDTF